MSSKKVYLIGSLRNPEVVGLANRLREVGYEVFDDWFAAGPTADDAWQEYNQRRGVPYGEALRGLAAKHILAFDRLHLGESDICVLIMPSGKSGHMEFGWFIKDKPGFVLFDKVPDRWDQMYQLAFEKGGGVAFSEDELIQKMGDV